MMFVISDATDVVPGCGLMTPVTLGRLGRSTASGDPLIFLARNLFRNHFEVHHVVTRRCLVALSAVQIAWSWMLKSGNPPMDGYVALSAVFAEETQVPVFGDVASIAVKSLTRGTLIKLSRDTNP